MDSEQKISSEKGTLNAGLADTGHRAGRIETRVGVRTGNFGQCSGKDRLVDFIVEGRRLNFLGGNITGDGRVRLWGRRGGRKVRFCRLRFRDRGRMDHRLASWLRRRRGRFGYGLIGQYTVLVLGLGGRSYAVALSMKRLPLISQGGQLGLESSDSGIEGFFVVVQIIDLLPGRIKVGS